MKILCYGDSNTFGFDPRSPLGARYDACFRWVDILAAQSGWEVHNNGMNGRTIPVREVCFPESLDLLIIMLGTNDLLQGASPEETALRMGNFIEKLPMEKKKILLLAPPPMKRGEWVTDDSLISASAQLARCYQTLASRLGVMFADAGAWNVSIAYDGVHLTESGHMALAQGLLNYIKHHL